MSDYLGFLEGVLRTGLEGLGPAFKQAQVAFVLSRQCADGGFRGRLGASDLYYTDFALRLLALVAPGTTQLSSTAAWLAQAVPPSETVGCFNLLNCHRLLAQCGHEIDVDKASVERVLRAQTPSAYRTFLAGLCFQMLAAPMPRAAEATAAIALLQGPGGGFREQRGEGQEQTNATAAAVAFLLLEERLTEEQAQDAVNFMVTQQADDGGFLAHPSAPLSDLLSTFTALATLAGLAGFERVDLPAVARFLRQTAMPTGGFKAAPTDTEPDVEYTYYGLGSLALIHAALG